MRVTAVFFVFMLCFTILSRAADQMGIIVVETERPQNMVIGHSVRATGKIVQNQELAVTTEPDQRVTAIHVSEGQRVSKGDLLFELDMTLLEEKILNQKQELEKQELNVTDAKSQKEVSEQQKANEQAQAAEQYSLNMQSAGMQLSRAKDRLSRAQQELKEFRKSSGTTQVDDSVEAALEQALTDRTNEYIAAQQELTSLQWKIENDVNAALQAAQSGAVVRRTEVPRTQSSEEILLSEEEGGSGSAVQMDAGDTDPVIDIEEVTGGMPTMPTENNSGDASDLFPEPPSENKPGPAVTPEELAQIEQSVRNSYSQALAEAQQKVEDALAGKQEAESALMAYRQERISAGDANRAAQEKQLLENVQAAQQAYEDAAIAANQAAVTSGRAVSAAGIPNASNSSDRLNEITYEQMELSLKKLEKLKSEGGKVYAATDGLVLKVQIQTGEKTSDTTAVLMADLTKGYRFTADITKEQEKYIGTGDQVTLSGSNKKQKLEGLAVESVTVDEKDESVYHVVVQVPEGTFEIGMTAAMDFVKKSAAYPVTVPLSALRLDDRNQAYVLVPEEYESIMGTETKARKVGVTVQEKNESYAALAEGALDSGQSVIVRSDKAVEDGSRIRIEG